MVLNQTDKDNALLPASYITDTAYLSSCDCPYADEKRVFQGIPGIEATENGTFYAVFYASSIKDVTEGNGNYLVVLKSRDGDRYSPCMVVLPPAENTRCYDSCLWIDPLKRLWLFWTQSCGWYDGRCGVWAAVCENPDDDTPIFSAPRRIANGVMMNKPTVLQNGDWLLPCAVWGVQNSNLNRLPEERFSNVYLSCDNGKTFTLGGHTDYPDRGFDEHMTYQRADGSVVMLIRAKKVLGEAVSRDNGRSFGEAFDSEFETPNSRFCIRRLTSGRLLFVNHKNFVGRNNLYAMLSEDDGRTWNDGILLDERSGISYPDVTETPDGYLHIIYDYNRITDKQILVAKLREADILAGKVVSEQAVLKKVINQAYGVYEGRPY